MDFIEQLRILEEAKGNPALLALATVEVAHHRLSAEERSRIKDALFAAAVPHWCDREMLAVLLQATPDEADRLLSGLSALTVIESFPARGEDAINVHETARLALREHLRRSNVSIWQALSARARDHVARSEEPHSRIEALYHHFAIDQHAAAEECEALDREFNLGRRPEVRHALALALQELASAGWLTGAAEVEARLPPLEVRNQRGEAGAQLESEAREILEIARSTSAPSAIGRAQCILGDILQTRTHLDDAMGAFQEFLAIFQRLTKGDPSKAGWQRELAVAHIKVGDIDQEQRRFEEAWANFRESLAIFERLTVIDPSNIGWRRELAVAHSRVGDVRAAQDRPNEALDDFHQYLAIAQQLTAIDDHNTDWLFNLAVAHSKVGDMYRKQGHLDDAVAAFREELAAFQRLTEIDPTNTRWQRQLAITHARTGDIHRELGRLDDAVAAFREYRAIFQRLTAADPSNVGWQHELAGAYLEVGNITQKQGRLDDALAAFGERLAIFQRLTKTDPSNAGWQHGLAIAHNRLGQIFQKLGDEKQAQSCFRSAVDAMASATKMSPANERWKIDLENLETWIS